MDLTSWPTNRSLFWRGLSHELFSYRWNKETAGSLYDGLWLEVRKVPVVGGFFIVVVRASSTGVAAGIFLRGPVARRYHSYWICILLPHITVAGGSSPWSVGVAGCADGQTTYKLFHHHYHTPSPSPSQPASPPD